MLVVKIELWPYGSKANSKEIGRTYIWNDGSGTHETGNYGVAICADKADFELEKGQHPVEKAEYGAKVKDHNRRENVWRLVKKAIAAAIP